MNDTFIKAPIYYEFKWESKIDENKKYIINKIDNLIDFMRLDKDTMRTYCSSCEDDESFTTEEYFTKGYRLDAPGSKVFWIAFDGFKILNRDRNTSILYYRKEDIGKVIIFQSKYKCNLEGEHFYSVYFTVSFTENHFVITKIGQNISPYIIGLPDTRKYEKQLVSFKSLEDYRKMFVHMIHNDYVASLLYLRRVFEKMVYKLVDGATLSDNHFETKVKYLKENNKLDPTTEDLSQSVYSLLSKGIHELTNNECMELFESLSIFIELQLYHIKTSQEREALKKRLHKNINANYQKHK